MKKVDEANTSNGKSKFRIHNRKKNLQLDGSKYKYIRVKHFMIKSS